MLKNFTEGLLVRKEDDSSGVTTGIELLTNEQALYIMRILMFGVTPAISVLGIVGNIFSIIILLKHGLHKCSNILLLALAGTDITFLVAFNSIPKILYEVVDIEFAYPYSKGASYFLVILFSITNTFDYGMACCSLSIPMLITLERLIAVYLPFKFNLIVTPARTWCSLALIYLFWFSIYIYMACTYTFRYVYDIDYNKTIGLMERSDYYYQNIDTVHILEEVIDYMVTKIPPAFTLCGCILISVKVQTASRKRQKMTQSSAKEVSSNRTTKMLLAVCVVYIFTALFMSLPVYIPQYMSWTLTTDAPSNFARVLYQVMNIVVCINSSVNFVVYVGLNKNFRDTYKSLFATCMKAKK